MQIYLKYCNVIIRIHLFIMHVIALIMGIQGGYTSIRASFVCGTAEPTKNITRKLIGHLEIDTFKVRSYNIIHKPLVNPRCVLLPPLYIKLGLMKNYVKSLNKEGAAFAFLLLKFTPLLNVKIKAGIFFGPQIRSLMRDNEFELLMNEFERNSWQSLKTFIKDFLGNRRSEDYISVAEDLMKYFENLGTPCLLKMHFLRSHLNYFSEKMRGL